MSYVLTGGLLDKPSQTQSPDSSRTGEFNPSSDGSARSP